MVSDTLVVTDQYATQLNGNAAITGTKKVYVQKILSKDVTFTLPASGIIGGYVLAKLNEPYKSCRFFWQFAIF